MWRGNVIRKFQTYTHDLAQGHIWAKNSAQQHFGELHMLHYGLVEELFWPEKEIILTKFSTSSDFIHEKKNVHKKFKIN